MPKIRRRFSIKNGLIIAGVVGIVCAGIFIFKDKIIPDTNDEEEIIQSVETVDEKEAEKRKVPDDLRLHNFPYIQITDKVAIGDMIDIRISFSNGADYVLLSKKEVIDCSTDSMEESETNSLWMEVSEEEILRLSSAVVDASISEGCNIYAIKYIEEDQKGAIVNYPVSAAIEALIENDPNIVKRASDVVSENLRDKLEAQLDKNTVEKYEGSTGSNSVTDNSEGQRDETQMYEDSLVYEKEEQQELEFFD